MYPSTAQTSTRPLARLSAFFSEAKVDSWTIFLLMVSLTILYWPVQNFSYLAIDDGMHTEMNPRITPFTQENLLSFWKEPYENAYTPLTYTAWMALSVLAKNSPEERAASASSLSPEGLKLDPGVFHVGNAVVHFLTCVIVYFLLKALLGSAIAASFGVFLFAWHPLQVESVCWITGLRDVLAGGLTFASIYFYILYAKAKYPTGNAVWNAPFLCKKNLWYVLAFVFFFLATLGKSSSLVTPILMGILGFCFLGRPLKILAVELLPWFLAIVPLMPIFTGLNASVADKVVFKAPLEGRIIVALDATAFYLGKLFFPHPLVMDYGRTPQYVLQKFPYYLTAFATLAAGIVVSVLAMQRKGLWLFASFLIFVVGLAPVLGINPFIFQHISTVADRYVYVSMLAPALALAWYIQHSKARLALPVCSVLLFVLCVKSFAQIPVWENNLSLFSYNLRFNPRSWLASNDLGTVYENRKEYGKAAELYKQSAVLSNIPSAWNNYGATSLKAKDYEGAIRAFTEALITSSYAHWAYNNLATAYAYSGNLAAAKENFEKALETAPGSKWPERNLKILQNKEPLSRLHIQRSSQEDK
jgi:protein O-mannosyl-transferase